MSGVFLRSILALSLVSLLKAELLSQLHPLNCHAGQYSASELHVVARRGWAPEWVEGGHRCGWQDLLLPRCEWGDELGASDGERKRRFGQVHGGARR